jgi:predicted nucleotidyltransferase
VDLSSPISSVIPLQQGAVLSVLAQTEAPLTGRGVARLLGGRASQSKVNRILTDLAASGIVRSEHHPPAHLYHLNRDHLAADAIIALATMRTRMIALMAELATSWTVPAASVALFGSAARGDGDVGSDIDVLVIRRDSVAEEDGTWQRQQADLARTVSVATGNDCRLLELSETELRELADRGERLANDLRTDAIHLAGDRLKLAPASKAHQ